MIQRAARYLVAGTHAARFSMGAIFFVLACATLFISSVAMADGIGGGGNGGGGGGHQSIYGWGWRLYTVASAGPNDGFRNGTPWTAVRSACQSSSTQVAVFVVNDVNNTQMGYDYHDSWYSPFRFSNYKGDSGAPWMTMAAAQAGFNALNPAVKAGYTFGSNVSWYCYGSLPQWTTSGTSSVNASVVSPGTTVTWTHRAINQGPAKTDKGIRASVIRSGFGPVSYAAIGSSAGVAKNGTVASMTKAYKTTLADAGHTLCERLSWSPNAYNSTSAELTNPPACVSVRFAGGVSQQLTFDPLDAVVDDSTKINITFDATNTTRSVVPVTFDGYVWYDRNYNGVLDAGETKIFTKGGAGSLPGSPTTTTTVARYAETVNITNGGRLCAFWNVSSATRLASNLDGPDVRCTYIGFAPKLQAWGNDIRVGSSFTQGQNVPSLMLARVSTIKSGPSTTYAGTWSEYGLFAPFDPAVSVPRSSILDVASAAWPADTSPSATASQSSWSNLTFGNAFNPRNNSRTASCSYGCFADPDEMGQLPGIEKYLIQHGMAGAPNVTMLASGAGTYNITTDIINSGGAPRIIIADNIAIKDTVKQVDAWLIARNSINTCTGPVDLKLGDCKQTLRINGPIIAKTLLARRLGDIQANKKNAVGEVVNLRGDAYIWAYNASHTGAGYQTTNIKELPPRY